jgi:L-ascorbate metabolism protein UlaG (beta-lactamase superfamily)
MEITWYGHSCFRLIERGMAAVVTDPYDHTQVGYSPLKLKADIVTVSHDLAGHNHLAGVKGDPYIISGPGEYEVGGVFITAIQTNGKAKKDVDELRNLLCLLDFFGLTVAHLGAMNQVPSQAEVEALGPVHIALVPVGGGTSLNAAKAAEVISLLEPNIVIPMHYATPETNVKLDPLKKFLKEMGLPDIQPEPLLKIAGTNSLPEETKVVVLSYKNSNGG